MSEVMTATGPVRADALGVVLPHEHIFINELREDRANGLLNNAAVMRRELERFAEAGGTTIVELTSGELTAGACPDPKGLYSGVPSTGYAEHGTRAVNHVLALRELSVQTGVNLVLGTSHYRDPYLDEVWLDRASVDEIAERMVLDLTEGFPGTSVRAGIIGEVGADKWHVSAREERSIRAAARAHKRTGATVTTHTSKWPVGTEVIDLLVAEGVEPSRIIAGHASTIDIAEYHLDLARRGVYVQFDTIRGGSPAGVERWLDMVLALVSAGHADQVLLSHDVCLRDHLGQNGGCGYTYLLTDFLGLLHKRGLEPAETDRLVRDNPRRALTAS